MPVSFLTDDQRVRYARFNGEPTHEQLARYFLLDDRDRKLINSHRGDHSRLGFTVQLCTARFIGAFLEDLADIPPGVVNYLAHQLGIEQLSCFVYYRDSETRWDHASEIRRHCGFREFIDSSVQFRLNRWLYALCWTGTDRPGVLFDRATTWLITQKVLLPAVTTLERHVARLRNRVEERICTLLSRMADPATRTRLEALLSVSEDGRQSILDKLRKGPFRRSAPEMVRALQRVEDVRKLGIDLTGSHRLPPGRLQAMARFAGTAKAAIIQRLPESRRLAMLVAFVMNLEASALDDALDLLDILISEMLTSAARASDRARLRTLKDLDSAAQHLSQIGRMILDDKLPDSELRVTIFNALKREDLESALDQIDTLVRPAEDVYYEELRDSYPRIQRFLPALLKSVQFGSTPAGQPVVDALNYLSQLEEHGRPKTGAAPMQHVTRGWRQYVLNADGLDRKAYVFCCLDRMRSALRRRDIFVAPSIRYADARLGLLSESAWNKARPTIARSLGHSLSGSETLGKLSRQLDATYKSVARNLPSNPLARVEEIEGKAELVVSAIDKAEEPDSLIRLREAVNARLPRVDLPEVLLEIAARTEFTSKFTHVSERESRMNDLRTSLCACLIADACNIGPEPLIRGDMPALRRSRLSWVSQNFIRNETPALLPSRIEFR